ncbi:MAG: hypothetical protein QOF75_2045 [Gaiellaceae bacterium]|jgi:hypothetical protein|nr:hypothetical protein [Gaiellaceae bacterium]
MKSSMLARSVATLTALVAASAFAATASARSAAAPTVTAIPTLQGPVSQPFVGDKLSVTNGSWTGSPTKYTYEWDRCDAVGDRQNCAPIVGATAQSYTVTTADANHTLRAQVTATNADGSATSDTKGSGVVAARGAPKNTARPTISGSNVVGSTLTANNGTWTGAATFSYQWQRCDSSGNNCVDVSGATGKTYGVTADDVGHELRALVKASNRFGATTADTDRTTPVTANTQTTTVVQTTTVPGKQSPTIQFLSLRKAGVRIYARFRVCANSGTRLTVIERDTKAHTVAYTRRFGVSPVTCATYARNWLLIQRFRRAGRLVVTLRAQDTSGRSSSLVSKGLTIR